MEGIKELTDAGKKAAKEQFKRWLEAHMSDPKAIIFMVDQFDLAYDLIAVSIEKGGMPSKGDVIRYLAGKTNSFAGFSDDNRVVCVSSIVSLGLTASAAPAAGAAGPPAWTWYVGAVLLDMLDAGGNCYLAYQDAETERQIEKFRKQIEARRAWGFANAACSAKTGHKLGDELRNVIDYRSKTPQALMSQ